MLGLEREWSNLRVGVVGMAGLRTHMLVAIGACLLQLISVQGYDDVVTGSPRDPSRLAAQVTTLLLPMVPHGLLQAVSGIGFVGAGAIWSAGEFRRGLTTASTIWLAMALGLASGVGFWVPALWSCFLSVFSLVGLKKLRNSLLNRVRLWRCCRRLC